MTDPDPVEIAMQEILPSDTPTKSAAPNPFDLEPAVDVGRAILEPLSQKPSENRTLPKLANLPRDNAIALRWTLRDIDRKRTKFLPVSPADLELLMEMGLVEINDDTLSLTAEGHRAIG